MTEIKKTLENPPSRLAKKIISLSVSDYWEEARAEWKMVYYYYVQTYHPCLCSPREARNITVIENIHNSNQMEVCNSCAVLFMGIKDCVKIESIVRRLKKNRNLNMDETCLRYLFNNGFIDELELKNYNLIRLSRKDEYSCLYRQELNSRIINITDYANKPLLEMLDALILWSKKQEKLQYLSVFIRYRKKLASKGVVNVAFLEKFIKENGVELLSNEDKRSALEIIGEESQTTLDLEEYIKSSKRAIRREKNLRSKLRYRECLDKPEELPRNTAFNLFYCEGLEDSMPLPTKTGEEEEEEEKFCIHERNEEIINRLIPPYIFKDQTIPEEIINSSKLEPENLDYIYTNGAGKYAWSYFSEFIEFPITSDSDMLELASLVYNWYTELKSSTLFYYFFEGQDQKWMKFILKHVPFHKDFVEVDYICTFLKLLPIDAFCFLLKRLCECTRSAEKIEMLISKVNQILRRSSYELVLGTDYDCNMVYTGSLDEKVPIAVNISIDGKYKGLTPFQLTSDGDLSERESYRYELFGNTYFHFKNGGKFDRKFANLDSLFKNGHFPLERKALLIVSYFMYVWSVEVIKSESYYQIVTCFEKKGFEMGYASMPSLFFHLPEDRKWINMFWLLLPCKRKHIELLLEGLLLSMPIDIRQDKIGELNAMLVKEGYEAKCLNRKAYIELVRFR